MLYTIMYVFALQSYHHLHHHHHNAQTITREYAPLTTALGLHVNVSTRLSAQDTHAVW
jgi:hypothetical protein